MIRHRLYYLYNRNSYTWKDDLYIEMGPKILFSTFTISVIAKMENTAGLIYVVTNKNMAFFERESAMNTIWYKLCYWYF